MFDKKAECRNALLDLSDLLEFDSRNTQKGLECTGHIKKYSVTWEMMNS